MTAGVVPHPLDRLSADELCAARAVIAAAGLLGERVRFASLTLAEPPRPEVLAFDPGAPLARRVRALLLDTGSGAAFDVLVSLTDSRVEAVAELADGAGQLPMLDAEMELVEAVLIKDERWLAALHRRGIDPSTVRAAPLSVGAFTEPDEAGRRIISSLGFVQRTPRDHAWAHPVDGLVAHVDLIAGVVTAVLDHRVFPVPHEPGNFDDPAQTGPHRTTLRPIEITQPDGPSFTVDGDLLQWEGWRVRLGFNAREGLTLHQLGYAGRPILYRAAIAEMVVPYGDPSPSHYWQNYFDAGEYSFGRSANSLELGCDCLGEIHYEDVVVADDDGRPRTIRNAICLHEEDFGVLWKHTDPFTGSRETRRQRRLVVSFFTTVGNYDYGFYWYLYLDGTIACEVKATGVVFTSAYPAEGSAFESEIAPGLGAPYHQHLFCARLDVTVGGPHNAVDEVDVVPVPMGQQNPYGNAFTTLRTRLGTESGAQRSADATRGRTWQIVNPGVRNRLGHPVAYALVPEPAPTLLAAPGSSIHRRASFATKHLWVTRYSPQERFPAGDYVNQHPGGAGLPQWTAADRNVDNTDIVLWHTFGLTHVPRTEDWPIMPVDRAGFSLRPIGFFDRNPTLDVAPSTGAHCH